MLVPVPKAGPGVEYSDTLQPNQIYDALVFSVSHQLVSPSSCLVSPSSYLSPNLTDIRRK